MKPEVSGVYDCLDLILSLLDTPPSMPRFIFQKFGLPLHRPPPVIHLCLVTDLDVMG
jgi:hypothetical protein